jgi:serine/threonine-protein kinase HipA
MYDMRKAEVFYNNILAGELTEMDRCNYLFRYNDDYFHDPLMPAISLTLDKKQQEYHAVHLFSFFYNMLSEGSNRALQSRLLHIDENDNFGILLATAQTDTTGAITVKPMPL